MAGYEFPRQGSTFMAKDAFPIQYLKNILFFDRAARNPSSHFAVFFHDAVADQDAGFFPVFFINVPLARAIYDIYFLENRVRIIKTAERALGQADTAGTGT